MNDMKLKTGFPLLDKMLKGGFPSQATILLSGGPGTGKTLFSLRYLAEGLTNKERCCYVSLSEDKEELLRAAESIASLAPVKENLGKRCAIEHIQLGENITMKKFNAIIAAYPTIDRLVIDNINKLLIFSENKNAYRIHLSELIRQLKAISKSTILICESENDQIDTGNGESFETDGVIQLSFHDLEEKPSRIIQVHKLRFSAFDPKVPYAFTIKKNDIIINQKAII